MKSVIDAGEVGDIYFAKTDILRRRGAPKGLFGDKAKSGGGPLIDIGVHMIDAAGSDGASASRARKGGSITRADSGTNIPRGSRYTAPASRGDAFDVEDSSHGINTF
jgi:hypothetical protein